MYANKSAIACTLMFASSPFGMAETRKSFFDFMVDLETF
jgi:hypothetical protein